MKKLLVIILVAGCVLAMIGTLRAISQTQFHSVHQGNTHSGTIEGLVLNPEGQPVSQAVVFARRENFLKGLIPFDKTDEQGRFVITNLKPGTYEVYASKEEDDYPLPISTFHTGGSIISQQANVYEGQVASDVVIHLAPKAAKLVGRVMDAATKRPKSAQITLRRVDNPNYYFTTGADEKGNCRILVPPVRVTVDVSGPGYVK